MFLLCVWLLKATLPVSESISDQVQPSCVSADQLGVPFSALPVVETKQDRGRRVGGNKAFSRTVGHAGERERKGAIWLLCKPLFHFHTSLTPSL